MPKFSLCDVILLISAIINILYTVCHCVILNADILEQRQNVLHKSFPGQLCWCVSCNANEYIIHSRAETHSFMANSANTSFLTPKY